jgi:inorganic pyrophosphatase
MPRDLTKLPHKLDVKRGACRAIVETSKGRRGKMDYDPKTDTFRLKTFLPDGMSFPLDFGFIPATLADDGDPLDVMILADEPNASGTLLDVRLIGVIEAEEAEHDRKERNDRILAAAAVSNLYAAIKSIENLEAGFIENLVQFWINKDRLEGKEFRCIGVHGPSAAIALVEKTAKAAKS